MNGDYQKVLLVVHGGASADSPGVRRAAELARGAPMSVDLFSAVYEPALHGYMGHRELYESLRTRLVGDRRLELERLSDAVAGLVPRSCDAKWGSPADTVPARAAETGAQLVIVDGSGPRAELTHDDWQLISNCAAPLLVVRSDGAAAWRNIVAAVDPYHEHGKPQELDAGILRHARAMQRLTSARLSAVHCFTPLSLFGEDVGLGGAMLDGVERELEAARREALDETVRQAGLSADSAVLSRGRPDEVLIDLAARGDADLLVLGTVSRGRLERLVIGSTAQRVLKSARCDVLLVRPGDGL